MNRCRHTSFSFQNNSNNIQVWCKHMVTILNKQLFRSEKIILFNVTDTARICSEDIVQKTHTFYVNKFEVADLKTTLFFHSKT